jgi:hypothetical protein
MSRISVGLTTVYFIITLLLISTGSIVHEALAFKLTASSFEDGVTRGMNDAQCDSNQCHGHGYDSSCPSGHTSTFCRGYAQGYSQGWNPQPGSPDERGPNGGKEDQGNHQSLTERLCNAVKSGSGTGVIAGLHALGLATGGTLNTALILAQGYCSLRGSLN